jgi:diguanylate cyclase (GGDEF)-like protein
MACVRVCPVEAIAVTEDQIRIVDETCIECGLCVPSCHHDALDVLGDVERCRESIEAGRALLLLPTEVSVYFFPATPEQVINASYGVGFSAIQFEALGDELIAEEYLKLWREGSERSMFRSTSPIVVNYCRTKIPELLPFLAPVVTPAVALARYIKATEGPKYDVIYAGLGAPGPNGGQEGVDIAISLRELEDLFGQAGIDPLDQPLTLSRMPPQRRRYLSIAGGLPLSMVSEQPQNSRRFRKERGLDTLGALARAAIGEETPLGFVDVLPFEGNLGHPAFGPPEDLYWRKEVAELSEPPRSNVPVVAPPEGIDLATFFEPKSGALPPADPAEVQSILEAIGRTPEGNYWNSGSCGHATCLEFAAAVARGRSTLSLCPIYLGRQFEQAARDALHDGLTGVYTFRVLTTRLDEELSRASRTGTSVAVLFIDLDRFKPVNDQFGHAAGNQILKNVARILTDATRSTDIVCRYGGDEFVVILVNPDQDGTGRVAEQIRREAEQMRIATPAGEVGVTLSIGLAYHSGVERTSISAEELMAEADASLYVAKAQGGNTVHPAVGGRLVG